MGIFPFTTASRQTLRPTQPSIQWAQGAPSLAVKRPGREADHSPPSNTDRLSWRGAHLIKSTGTTLPFIGLKNCSNVLKEKE
jgi:hypothetical protein